MRFTADLHMHSKYSRACSKDCVLEHIAWSARRKGVNVVGTGDFTHPAWAEELRTKLVPAEPGLFRLRDDLDERVRRSLPASCQGEVRFLLEVEISTIYKRGERTRKVHHLCYVPDLAAAERFAGALGRIGNIASDGRPILGLDSRDLLDITLDAGEGSHLIPAHVWTPWFAVLGSKSGFDLIEDCYGEKSGHITAIETGLSSSPEMNWRVPALDRFRLTSNSDAHSPGMVGRNATMFDTDLDYHALHRALATGDGYVGTIDMFPEEGKYHADGHRACGVRFEPEQTRAADGRCPECGRPLTVGVLYRVAELAGRGADEPPPASAGQARRIVPLPEVLGELLGVGPKSKTVTAALDRVVAALGPELGILSEVPLPDIAAAGVPLLAEAIGRLRRGEVRRESGYDGEYGRISLFAPGELADSGAGRAGRAAALFDLPAADDTASAAAAGTRRGGAARVPKPRVPDADLDADGGSATPSPADDTSDPVTGVLAGLDPEQRAAAGAGAGPLLIVAGPGTGKTRTITHRIAHLVGERGVPPEQCLAITFTRRASEELRQRLADLLLARAEALTVTTFHGLGLDMLRAEGHRVLGAPPRVADRDARLSALREAVSGGGAGARERDPVALGKLLDQVSAARREPKPDAVSRQLVDRYTAALHARGLVDFDDLIALPVRMLTADPELAAAYRDRFRWVFVDEYQDVDAAQYQLLRLLVPADGNLCAIGDPDQAIYAFRGADVEFFLRFGVDFPGVTTVRLSRNYRSTPVIVRSAMAAIEPGTLVPGRTLVAATRPAPDAAAKVIAHEADDAEAEAAFVVRAIEELLGGSSFHARDSGTVREDGATALSFDDIAVLYRTDAQAKPLVEALSRAGLPVQKRSHDRLTDRPGVADLVRVLTERLPVAVLPGAADGLLTQVEVPEVDVVAALREAAAAMTAAAEAAGAEPDEVALGHAALDLLLPLARAHQQDPTGFLTDLSLGAEVDTWDPRAERISLLTLHAAKGLEFLVVFLIGCEDGLLPLRFAGHGNVTDAAAKAAAAAAEAEERRLFFVGLSRAQRHLYLTHTRSRFRRAATPSPFLAALGPDLLERYAGGARPSRRRLEQQLRLI